MKAHSLLAALVLTLILLAAFLLIAAPGMAAPAFLSCSAANAAIKSPAPGSTVSGPVEIIGTAALEGQFQAYKLKIGPSGGPLNDYGGLVRTEVKNGQLGVWDSASVRDGDYDIRLEVIDLTGNYCDNPESTARGIHVRNSAPPTPTDEPTPTETEGPVPTSVVPTTLPTIVVPGGEFTSGQAQATARPTSDGTETPTSSNGSGSTSLIPGGLDVGGVTSGLGELMSGYARAFVFGVLAMAGLFLVVGVVYYVRRVL